MTASQTVSAADLAASAHHDAGTLSRRALTSLYLVLALVVALVGVLVATYGAVALGLVALAAVPVIFVVLLLITLGS